MADEQYNDLSKIPRIITDPNTNVNLVNMKFQMTLEKYHDLLHHTHNFSDLVGEDGPMEDIHNQLKEINDNIKKILDYIDHDIQCVVEDE